MSVCLPCARAIMRDRSTPPCGHCLAESERDPVAEAHAAVARYMEEMADKSPATDLLGLTLAVHRGNNLTLEQRREKGAAYMRAWRAGNERYRRKKGKRAANEAAKTA